MTFPYEIGYVLERIIQAGYEAYLVGGCVRDSLMDREPHDYDICSSATVEELCALFAHCRIIETGLKHGTVTLLINGTAIEVTEFRCGKSIEDDLRHRDLTVNAIAWSEKDGYIDPFGAIADIENGIIRAVDDPVMRFREDPLRILRAMRFASVFGFETEKETAEAMKSCSTLLCRCAPERVKTELDKMLCGINAATVMDKHREILAVVLPEISAMFDFEQHNPHHCYDVWRHSLKVTENIPPLPHLRWAAFLHDVGKPPQFFLDDNGIGHFYGHDKKSEEISREILQRLRFDNASAEKILWLISHHCMQLEASDKPLKRALSKFGGEALFELIGLFRADSLGQSSEYYGRLKDYELLEEKLREILESESCLSIRALAVNGHDMMALGFKGKEIGDALEALLEAVLEGKVINAKAPLTEYAQKLIQAKTQYIGV